MKRVIALVVIGLVSLGLAACGGSSWTTHELARSMQRTIDKKPGESAVRVAFCMKRNSTTAICHVTALGASRNVNVAVASDGSSWAIEP